MGEGACSSMRNGWGCAHTKTSPHTPHTLTSSSSSFLAFSQGQPECSRCSRREVREDMQSLVRERVFCVTVKRQGTCHTPQASPAPHYTNSPPLLTAVERKHGVRGGRCAVGVLNELRRAPAGACVCVWGIIDAASSGGRGSRGELVRTPLYLCACESGRAGQGVRQAPGCHQQALHSTAHRRTARTCV